MKDKKILFIFSQIFLCTFQYIQILWEWNNFPALFCRVPALLNIFWPLSRTEFDGSVSLKIS